MKFTDVRTFEHLLQEYSYNSSGKPQPSGSQSHGQNSKDKDSKGVPVAVKTVQKDTPVKDLKGNDIGTVVSTVGKLPKKDNVVIQDKDKNLIVLDKNAKVDVSTVDESKLSKIAKRKGKKLKLRKLKGKIKKLSKSSLSEADEDLFEINFNRKEIATQSLDLPIKCGFEAETFFYNVDESSSNDVDEMSVGDVEYEYGDLPDSAYSDFEDWLYDKGQNEYLEELIDEKLEEVREDEDYLNDFIDSSSGPTSEAVERYRDEFEENDPQEFENRTEDGWGYMNWVREFVEEEYEQEYLDWLRSDIQEDYDFDDDAKEAARSDYSMDDWVYDNYSYMSDFLNDYGYSYPENEGSIEGVANEFHKSWQHENSKYDGFPDYGSYGDTDNPGGWAVETDSSINADEGVAAELISPVFNSPREMLEEMRSLFDWSEDNFGTNNSTGLHITMSWNGEPDAPRSDDGKKSGQVLNRLKMAVLLGDEYLLAEFGRLRNSYTRSQYKNILKHAEDMDTSPKSFEKLESELEKGISREKFSSIHFKSEKDSNSGNKLIEFRIAGGSDYNTMFEKVVKAVVRYATVMKAGYDPDAYKQDYVRAISKLLRKASEIDPKRLRELEIHNHPVIDAAKEIVGKKDYFEILNALSNSVDYFHRYQNHIEPDADKNWKQSVIDFKKNTGRDPSWIGETRLLGESPDEEITGYIEPDSVAPSVRAPKLLEKSQEYFMSGMTILARDIAEGRNRNPVRAKQVGEFRKYAKELLLDYDKIQDLAIRGLPTHNFHGSDKENVLKLRKGIEAIFKKEGIIKDFDFMTNQQVDLLIERLWQFFATDDKLDNNKREKLKNLMIGVSPGSEKYIASSLKALVHVRQKNDFSRKLKSGGYDSDSVSLFKPGSLTNKKSIEKLLKFLEPYQGYAHPTTKDHHTNIKDDDRYAQVFQYSLMQRLRERLDYVRQLQTDDIDKYLNIKTKLVKIAEEVVKTLHQPNIDYPKGPMSIKGIKDYAGWGLYENDKEFGRRNLCIEPGYMSSINDFLDSAVKDDENPYTFTTAYSDRILDLSIGNLDDYYHFKKKSVDKQEIKDYGKDVFHHPVFKRIHKENLKAIRKFLSQFDKIFQAEGFTDLKQEIAGKNNVHKLEAEFIKNIRDNAKTTLNIPSHSYCYLDKEFFETITDESYNDRIAYLDNHLSEFNRDVNKGGKVWVIPASHWHDVHDAVEGMDLIDTFESAKNYYHSWRRTGYRRLIDKFTMTYGVSFEKLTGLEDDRFIQPNGNQIKKLMELGIEVTRQGDSRKGMPDQPDLVDSEELENPISGEPLNRSSAMTWQSIDNVEKEKKRFNAFDWSVYPEQMKQLVLDEIEEIRKESEIYFSFQLALSNVLEKVLKGEIDINPKDLGIPGGFLIKAAGVEGYTKDHSAKIAAETNWTNLTDALGIERGVNDQGVELLKKTYYMYDENSSGPYAAEGVSIERWIDAVKKANEYIEKNYTVSGGNYFRDNDYIGGRLGGPDSAEKTASGPITQTQANGSVGGGVTEDDYEDARLRFPLFNQMMQNGIQNYISRGSVNQLVGFLMHPDNNSAFQDLVLSTIGESGPFEHFRDALAAARRRVNPNDPRYDESKINSDMPGIFEKFDNLSLEKQLDVLSKIESKKIDEAYKRAKQVKAKSKKPKKIKPNKGHESPHPMRGKLVGESVPDNTKIRMLNHLLSDKMPANDIKKQMDAFFALPDPKMIKAFRDRRATGGDDACLRPILRSFIKRQMADTQQKFINLNESKLKELRIDNIDAESPDPERFIIVDSQGNEIKIGANLGSAKIIGIVPPSGDSLGSIITTKGKLSIPNKLGLKIIDKEFKQQELPLPKPEPTQLELPGMNKKQEESLKEYEDLEAEKEKIQDIVSKLDIEDEKDRELIDQIWRILNADHIQSIIGKLVVKPIADETAMNKEAATKVLTQVIYQIESSYDKIKEFLDDLEKTGSAYDVDALKQPINALSNVFKSDVGYTVFKTLLPYGVGSNKKGPGEFALAMLSDRVQLSDTTGDIVVDGELVEVKASKSETSSGGGRLGMGGMPQLQARDILLRYKDVIPSVASHLEDEGNKTLGITNFVKYLNQDLPVGDKRRYDITKEFYKDLFIPASVEKIAKAFQSSDNDKEIALQYAGANYNDYLTKGQFEALLAIDMYTGKTAYISNEKEFMEFQQGDHSGAMGISVVPSNSGPTESFVQMTFIKKGKI